MTHAPTKQTPEEWSAEQRKQAHIILPTVLLLLIVGLLAGSPLLFLLACWMGFCNALHIRRLLNKEVVLKALRSDGFNGLISHGEVDDLIQQGYAQ